MRIRSNGGWLRGRLPCPTQSARRRRQEARTPPANFPEQFHRVYSPDGPSKVPSTPATRHSELHVAPRDHHHRNAKSIHRLSPHAYKRLPRSERAAYPLPANNVVREITGPASLHPASPCGSHRSPDFQGGPVTSRNPETEVAPCPGYPMDDGQKCLTVGR